MASLRIVSGATATARLVLAAAAVVLLPRVVSAGDSVPDFQHDPVEHHASQVVTWLLCAGIVLVSYALLRVVRGQISGFFFRWLLVAGVVLVPVTVVSTGMMLALVRAERVEFCGSCHDVMHAHVEDMLDPDSGSLAAIHYRNQYIPTNQCYGCHTSYGLFGTFEAKMSGVGQVLEYYTDSYEYPPEMPEAYQNADCLKCHARSAKWKGVRAHTDDGLEHELYVDEVSCMECHADETPAHPELEREERR